MMRHDPWIKKLRLEVTATAGVGADSRNQEPVPQAKQRPPCNQPMVIGIAVVPTWPAATVS
jgi:hypothetical protein